MKLFKHILPVAALALGLASNGKADLVIAAPAAFTNLTQAAIDGNGTPFFDNGSADSGNTPLCNIGSILSGLADPKTQCHEGGTRAVNEQLAKGNGIYDYLNDGAGANVNQFSIRSTYGGGSIYLEMELAGARAGNTLEIRRVGDNATLASFVGADTSGATKQIVGLNAGDEYYFWFNPGAGSGTVGPFSSNASATRFALFRVGQGRSADLNLNSFVLGIEDGLDFDYNDMVVSANVVPEPASIIILSSAVLGTLALVRRRRAQK